MPKLPEQSKNSTLEVLDKENYSRGELTIPKIPKHHIVFKHHIKLVLIIFLIIVVLGLVFAVGKSFINKGDGQNTSQDVITFEYPLNVTEIKYPSETLKQKFLDNFTKASESKDKKVQFDYLQDNFLLLKGFYAETQSSEYRIHLEKYKEYMVKNYPDFVGENEEAFVINCLDLLCGKALYAQELESLMTDISLNESIDLRVKSAISADFQAAALSSVNEEKFTKYLDVISLLKSEYQRTNNEQIKSFHLKLTEYVKSNYKDLQIPQELNL